MFKISSMGEKTLKNVTFKLKTEEVLGELESLSFFFGKSQQEILEEALSTYWIQCLSQNKDLENYKKHVISNYKKGVKLR